MIDWIRATEGVHPGIAEKLSNAGLTTADAELRLAFGRIDPTSEMIITRVTKGHLQVASLSPPTGAVTPLLLRHVVATCRCALADKSAIDAYPSPSAIGPRASAGRYSSPTVIRVTPTMSRMKVGRWVLSADGDDARSLSCEGSGQR